MFIVNYLKLTRISGLFTAISNILVGFLLSNNEENEFSLPYLIAISSLLYCAGMTMNDFFDYRSDLTEHPNRVIPSGKIARKNAGILGLSTLAGAIIISLYIGEMSFLLTIVISSLIIVYDRFSKGLLIIGALNMAMIRFLNVVLGSSATGINQSVLLAASALFVFVFAITMVSRKESALLSDHKGFGPIAIGVVVSYVLILHIAGVIASHYVGIFLVPFAVLSLLPYKAKNAKVQQLVGSLVMSMILLDATLIAGSDKLFAAFIVALLYVPAHALSRIIKVS